jgi:DNA topoisomerase-3
LSKQLLIAEKPSVAREFAKALNISGGRHEGYLETEDYIVTWCVGHLVTMSYPEVYDPKYKKWSLDTLPFLPDEFKYEVIRDVDRQFRIVSSLLSRQDVSRIYVCTDSGREGEYIYRLVEMMSDPSVRQKDRRRVWIDSFTEEEVLRGIREARPESEYDNISSAAYLRAIEDYLMGINFSRLLTLTYGQNMASFLQERYCVISVGRVMTCVLGMVVRREREIRAFVKQPFYRVLGTFGGIEAEWKAVEGSRYFNSPKLYKDNGFAKRSNAEALTEALKQIRPGEGSVLSLTRKTERKNPPLLYNLAELQNDCSKLFRISPDQTLKIAQELYEKKLTTYPRTDARVLSSAVAKVIGATIKGLSRYDALGGYASEILENGSYKNIGSTRYTNDKAITDHYAIIPTGSGLNALSSLSPTAAKVYETIVKRFLSVFYPPAEYQKTAAEILMDSEHFFVSSRQLVKEGYLKIAGNPDRDKTPEANLSGLKKGMTLPAEAFTIREGETTPPKRYTSGSIILAMENAGQLIEDDDLREQIKGSGIGTSATRAEILKKLVTIGYLNLNKKTQVITPELMGEMVHDVVYLSIRALLNPDLTASWEKGLTGVSDGVITEQEYMEKLRGFIKRRCEAVRGRKDALLLQQSFEKAAQFYTSRTAPKRRTTVKNRKQGNNKSAGTQKKS